MCGNNTPSKSQRLPKNALNGQQPQWDDAGKMWIAQNRIIPVMYSELQNLLNTSKMVTGTSYRITDFQTKHKISTSIPVTINLGAIEPLTVFAIAPNKVHTQAFSETAPFDIIHYDISNTLCEDGITRRAGKITYRYDTLKNISCHYDWLNVKHRRYKIDITSHPNFNPTVQYGRYAVVTFNDSLWISTVPNNIGHIPSTDNYWCKLLSGISTTFHLHDTVCNFGNYIIKANTADYKDCYTFHNNLNDTLYNTDRVYSTHIGSASAFASSDPYNNIVIQVTDTTSWIYANDFGDECRRMNFILSPSKSIYNNYFTPGIFEIYGRDFYNNNLWNGSGRLIFGTGATAFAGFYGQCIFGDGCSIFNSQYCLSNIFVGNNININIIGVWQNATIGRSNSRLYVTRPQGNIYILGDNIQSGGHIGTNFGDYTLTSGRLSSNDTCIDLFFTRVFNGTIGNGAIGPVVLETMAVPKGYRIDEILLYPSGMPSSSGAAISLGFTGSPVAGLNNIPISSMSSVSFLRFMPIALESNIDTNILLLFISGAVIPVGILKFHVHLVRVS